MAANGAERVDDPHVIVGTVVQALEGKVATLQDKYDRLKQAHGNFTTLNSRAIQLLHCQACEIYLSGQIYMCSSGHNFCRACHDHLAQCTVCLEDGPMGHNVAMETLSSMVLHPCTYKEEGCNKYFLHVNWQNQLDHETNCDRKLVCKFLVRMNEHVELPCLWRGKICDLLTHCMENHRDDVVLAVNEYNFRITLPQYVNALYFFKTFIMSTAENDVFMIRFLYHQDRKLLVPHAFYMGSSANLNNFKVSFRFIKNIEAVFSTTPLHCLQHVNISTLITDMPHLDQNMVAAFAENNAINCIVTVQRV